MGETGNHLCGFIYKLGVITSLKKPDQEYTDEMGDTLQHILTTLMEPDSMNREEERFRIREEHRTPSTYRKTGIRKGRPLGRMASQWRSCKTGPLI
ncbi:hypothetical protein J6590_031474 [Homalodisca vitripennis]|nr:hypothetical protein J6590_031474 [Homalodisca vitripennis]